MLRDRLYYLLNNNYQKDTTYLIAEYIILHLDKIGEVSIYDIAEDCHTSVATISRFCKKIGFPNFIEFRDACQIETDGIFDVCKSHPNRHALMKNGIIDLTSDLNMLNKQMMLSLQNFSVEKARKLVKDIYQFKKVYFIGHSNSSIMYGHLQIELMNLRKYCYVITELSEEEFVTEKEESLAILFSMHGYMVKYNSVLVEWATKNCEKVWEISQVNKRVNKREVLHFGKCDLVTADYMVWIYVADFIIYEYKKLLE